MTSTVYIELIENFLASELQVAFDNHSILACDCLTKDQLDLFSSQFYAVDSSQHDLMARPVSRPIRTDSSDETDVDFQNEDNDIKPTSAMFTHPYNGLAPLAVDHLKRQLLFFSRVAVVVPSLNLSRDLQESRKQFKSFLKSFLDLKALVEDQTIELLPLKGFYSNEIEGGAGIVRQACNEDSKIMKWIESERQMLEDFALDARRGDPYFDAGIRICSALTYGHTLAATHPFVGMLYERLLDDRANTDRSKIMATQNLNKIHLPGLSGLDWHDINSVRKNEDCLQQWRADLQVAISSVDPYLPSEKFVERFNSQVQAQLARAALDLDRELKRSSSMTRFKKGSTNLAISAVAGTAKFLLGDPFAAWDEICKVAKSDGAKEAIRFFWESKEESAKRSLRSHYAVFSSQDRPMYR